MSASDRSRDSAYVHCFCQLQYVTKHHKYHYSSRFCHETLEQASHPAFAASAATLAPFFLSPGQNHGTSLSDNAQHSKCKVIMLSK